MKGENIVRNMKEVALSLLTGMIVGFLFAKLSLPIPAPPNVEAFMGIFGVWLGSVIMDMILGNRGRREK